MRLPRKEVRRDERLSGQDGTAEGSQSWTLLLLPPSSSCSPLKNNINTVRRSATAQALLIFDPLTATLPAHQAAVSPNERVPHRPDLCGGDEVAYVATPASKPANPIDLERASCSNAICEHGLHLLRPELCPRDLLLHPRRRPAAQALLRPAAPKPSPHEPTSQAPASAVRCRR